MFRMITSVSDKITKKSTMLMYIFEYTIRLKFSTFDGLNSARVTAF